MARKPTDKELALINRLAKRECSADEFYVFDAKPANDFMLTCYFYYLGTTSIMNFKADLDRERLRLGASHKRDLNFGRWLPGDIASVDTPEGAKKGRSYQLQAPFYMLKGLTVGQYNTDELAKGIEAGTLLDLSIEWNGGKPICDICGGDIRKYDECEHLPGREYDGVVCTFTVENAHLGACDLVDDGGLPLATLATGDGDGLKLADPGSLENIKKLSAEHPMTGRLVLSLSDIGNNLKEGGNNVNFEEFVKQFSKELAEHYVPKADHDTAVTDLQTQLTTAQTETTKVKEDLAKAQGDLTELTEKSKGISAELDASKDLIRIGETRLNELREEYHKLGVILYEDKWSKEAEDTTLNALEAPKRLEHLTAKITTMKEEVKTRLAKADKGDHTSDRDMTIQYSHLDNPALYRTKK